MKISRNHDKRNTHLTFTCGGFYKVIMSKRREHTYLAFTYGGFYQASNLYLWWILQGTSEYDTNFSFYSAFGRVVQRNSDHRGYMLQVGMRWSRAARQTAPPANTGRRRPPTATSRNMATMTKVNHTYRDVATWTVSPEFRRGFPSFSGN